MAGNPFDQFDEPVAPSVPTGNPFDQFDSTPGGAAIGNPNISAQGDKARKFDDRSLLDRASTVAGAGVGGAVTGALMPEILTAAAAGLRAIPQGARVAPVLDRLAAGAAASSRTAAAGAGAVSGLVGETLGQFSESQNAPGYVSELARLGGGLAPEFKTLAGFLVKKGVQASGLGEIGTTLSSIAASMGKRTEDLTAREKKYLETLINETRGGAQSNEPIQALGNALRNEASLIQGNVAKQTEAIGKQSEKDIAAKSSALISLGDAEANFVIKNAENAARKLIEEVQTGPKGPARIAQAKQRLREIGDGIINTAKDSRLSIAQDREVSDIGESLRGIVVDRNKGAISARDLAYKNLEEQRDRIVASKEQAGMKVFDLPEYQNLLNDIKSQLTPKNKLAPVTEQGVLSTYERIFNALKGQQVKATDGSVSISMSKEGLPIFEAKETEEITPMFGALDDVRKKLGTVFSGKPAAGYESINADIAKRFYKKISNIQKKFVGGEGEDNIQTQLLNDYANRTKGLEQFGTKSGKKLTAVDRYNDEEFSNDPSAIPSYFFKSKSKVNDLLELTGDRDIVVNAAKEYAINQLRNADSKGVRRWLSSNSDWHQVLPEVRNSIAKYADTLERAEKRFVNIEGGITRVEGIGRKVLTAAEKRAAGIETKAQQESTAIRNAAENLAISTGSKMAKDTNDRINVINAVANAETKALTGETYPIEHVMSLIKSGTPEEWAIVGPAIRRSPEAKAVVYDAVVQTVTRGLDDGGRTGIVNSYMDKVYPRITEAGIVSRSQANTLGEKLKLIEEMKLPDAEKWKFAKDIMRQSLAGYFGTIEARGVRGALRQIDGRNNAPPPP